MKKSLSIIALLLAVIMIAMCCAACGDDSKKDDDSTGINSGLNLPFGDATENGNSADQDATVAPVVPVTTSIVGTWKTSFELSSFMENYILQQGSAVTDEQIDLYRKMFEGTALAFTFRFNEDSTCCLAMDKDSLSNLAAQVKSNIKKYLPDVLAMYGITESDLTANGYTVDSFAELMASQIDTSALNYEDKNGRYRLDGSKLFVASDGKDFDESEYTEVSLSGNTLTILSVSRDLDGSSQMFADAMLPLVFTRQ